MSILIKGMKMPAKGEYELLLFCHSDGTATLEGHFTTKFEDEPFEVIEVPTSHGRLINADALYKNYQEICSDIACTTCPFLKEDRCEVEQMIMYALTIIEAEEGAEE